MLHVWYNRLIDEACSGWSITLEGYSWVCDANEDEGRRQARSRAFSLVLARVCGLTVADQIENNPTEHVDQQIGTALQSQVSGPDYI